MTWGPVTSKDIMYATLLLTVTLAVIGMVIHRDLQDIVDAIRMTP
jgi:ACT domain-containing protein